MYCGPDRRSRWREPGWRAGTDRPMTAQRDRLRLDAGEPLQGAGGCGNGGSLPDGDCRCRQPSGPQLWDRGSNSRTRQRKSGGWKAAGRTQIRLEGIRPTRRIRRVMSVQKVTQEHRSMDRDKAPAVQCTTIGCSISGNSPTPPASCALTAFVVKMPWLGPRCCILEETARDDEHLQAESRS
jgi:hypothetical protein